MLCDGCLLVACFFPGFLLSLASVSFRSCEDSFDYVCLSSSWTRSSSLRDFRQDDHYPRYHFYLCLLVARSFAMPRYLPLALSCLPYCHVKPLTHLVLANRCLAMLPLCSALLIALLVAGEVGVCSLLEHVYCWDIIIISCLL